jgi:hypothetical protein
MHEVKLLVNEIDQFVDDFYMLVGRERATCGNFVGFWLYNRESLSIPIGIN